MYFMAVIYMYHAHCIPHPAQKGAQQKETEFWLIWLHEKIKGEENSKNQESLALCIDVG